MEKYIHMDKDFESNVTFKLADTRYDLIITYN